MVQEKFGRVLNYVADSVETGYSAVFTFAVKEILNAQERREFASFLRDLTASQSQPRFTQSIQSNLFS